MADASSIIREYSLALGWQIDEPSFRQYGKVLKDTESSILAVGATLTATGLAAFAFTDKLSESMEKLYFATRRTGTTAAEFQGLQLSIANAGGSAAAAASSMEALSRFIKYTPGATDWLKAHGVDEKGLKDSATAIDELRERWVRMSSTVQGRAQSLAESQVAGVDFSTFQALISPDYVNDKKIAQQAQDMYGLKPEDLKHAHEFQEQLRDLVPFITAAGQKLESDLNGPMGKFVHLIEQALGLVVDFTETLQKYGFSKINNTIGTALADKMMDSGIPKGIVDDMFDPIGQTKRLFTKDYWNGLGQSVVGDLGATSGASKTAAEKAHAQLMAYGWSPTAAAGIVGNLMQESGVGTDPRMNLDPKHQGAAQWDYTRQAEFRHLFGHDLAHATAQEQIAFINYELTHKYSKAGAALRGATNTQDASDIVQDQYEVAPGQNTAHRELYAHQVYNDVGGNQMSASIQVTNHFHGPADPATVGPAVKTSVQQVYADIARQFLQ